MDPSASLLPCSSFPGLCSRCGRPHALLSLSPAEPFFCMTHPGPRWTQDTGLAASCQSRQSIRIPRASHFEQACRTLVRPGSFCTCTLHTSRESGCPSPSPSPFTDLTTPRRASTLIHARRASCMDPASISRRASQIHIHILHPIFDVQIPTQRGNGPSGCARRTTQLQAPQIWALERPR